MIAACLPREDPRDAFLARNAQSLAALPSGARIGTSSVRRHAQVKRARPDLEILPLRGNVDTRLKKLDAGEYDAMLLALAGLKRLGLQDHATEILSAEDWLPALAQGAIGIEIRKDNARIREAVGAIDDETTSIVIACERGFSAALGGSCSSAIGGLATLADGILKFSGEVLHPRGEGAVVARIEEKLSGDLRTQSAKLGREAGESIRPQALPWLQG